MLVLLLIFISVFLGGEHIANGQRSDTVYLSLNGNDIANSSNVLITDIGEGENALLCWTDLPSCCDTSRTGEWFFPSGTVVPIKMNSVDFYRNRGPGVVRLNRKNVNGTEPPTGLYCCQVPDATMRNRTVCANITTSADLGTFTAPENFTAIPTNSREIQFSWNLPSHVESDMNVSYSLTCRPNALGVTSVVMTYTEAGSYSLGGFRPGTEYNCSVFAFSGIRRGRIASINVTTIDDSSTLQLRLTRVNSCSQWVTNMDEDRDQKLEDITATVQESIQNLCQCGFQKDRITDAGWFPASPQAAVTYSAVIHGTVSTYSSELVSHIKRWVEGGTNLIIRQELLRVNGSCRDTATTPPGNGEGPFNSPTASTSNSNSFVLIGVALAIGIIAGAFITSIIAIIICCVSRHRTHQKTNTQSSPGIRIEATSPMFESGAGETSLRLRIGDPNTVHKSTDPMDHEYADLNEIGNKQRAQLRASHPSDGQSKTGGGYELTQCLAYGAVTHQ